MTCALATGVGERYNLFMKPRILKLDHDDPEAEFRFEIEWMVSMTEAQRMKLMLEGSRILRECMRQNGRSVVPRVLKRP